MSKTVNVRLYEVRKKPGNKVAFHEALAEIAKNKLDQREYEIDEDLTIRLERHSVSGSTVFGELVRLQGRDLPGKASKGKALEKLGIDSIGHSTVFAYNIVSAILAFQIARNGITAPLFGQYVAEKISSSSNYLLLPVPNNEGWDKLKAGRVRALRFRVSSPDELSAIDADTKAIRTSLRQMKETLKTSQIEITMSMRRGDPDVAKGRTMKIAKWFLEQLGQEKGGVSRVGAKVIVPGEDDTELLNLIEAHKGDKEKLDLPSDDPDKSYEIRASYVRKVLKENS